MIFHSYVIYYQRDLKGVMEKMVIDGSFTDKYRQVVIVYLPVQENVILHCNDKFPQGKCRVIISGSLRREILHGERSPGSLCLS